MSCLPTHIHARGASALSSEFCQAQSSQPTFTHGVHRGDTAKMYQAYLSQPTFTHGVHQCV